MSPVTDTPELSRISITSIVSLTFGLTPKIDLIIASVLATNLFNVEPTFSNVVAPVAALVALLSLFLISGAAAPWAKTMKISKANNKKYAMLLTRLYFITPRLSIFLACDNSAIRCIYLRLAICKPIHSPGIIPAPQAYHPSRNLNPVALLHMLPDFTQ